MQTAGHSHPLLSADGRPVLEVRRGDGSSAFVPQAESFIAELVDEMLVEQVSPATLDAVIDMLEAGSSVGSVATAFGLDVALVIGIGRAFSRVPVSPVAAA